MRNFFYDWTLSYLLFMIKLPGYIVLFIAHYLRAWKYESIKYPITGEIFTDLKMCQLSHYHIEELLTFYDKLLRKMDIPGNADSYLGCDIPSYIALWPEKELGRVISNLEHLDIPPIEDSSDKIVFMENLWVNLLEGELFPGEYLADYLRNLFSSKQSVLLPAYS